MIISEALIFIREYVDKETRYDASLFLPLLEKTLKSYTSTNLKNQKLFLEETKISKSTYKKIKDGNIEISPSTIRKIAITYSFNEDDTLNLIAKLYKASNEEFFFNYFFKKAITEWNYCNPQYTLTPEAIHYLKEMI